MYTHGAFGRKLTALEICHRNRRETADSITKRLPERLDKKRTLHHCCVDHDISWHRKADNKDHGDIDVAIAVEHLCLAAAEQDLGTCWVCNFDAKACHQIMQLAPQLEPVVLIPIGYPADNTIPEKKRKSIKEITL